MPVASASCTAFPFGPLLSLSDVTAEKPPSTVTHAEKVKWVAKITQVERLKRRKVYRHGRRGGHGNRILLRRIVTFTPSGVSSMFETSSATSSNRRNAKARSRTPLRPAPASAAIASRRSPVTGGFLIGGSKGAADASHGRLHSPMVGKCVGASELGDVSDRGDTTADGRSFNNTMPDDSRAHSIHAVNHHSLRSLFWAVS